MSPATQVKLLRVLQDGVVERLGGKQPVQVDVRIVAATNKDIAGEVRSGRFREDLFYRLNVIAVRLPPLRERRGDVPLLASAFLRRLAEKNGKNLSGFTQEALAALEHYAWPGNVRELEHAVERAVVLSRGGLVDEADLPEGVRRSHPIAGGVTPPGSIAIAIGTPMEEVERLVIRETLRHTRGDKNLAGQILGIAARTIYRKLDRDEAGRLVEPGASGSGEDR
jgi:two-component system response regulator HydG